MTQLTCRDVVDFLSDYLTHELEPAQRDAFEAHLAACDECVVYMRNYEETIRLGKAAFARLDAAADDVVPRALTEAILSARRKAR